MTKRDDRFEYENPRDGENRLAVYMGNDGWYPKGKDGVFISVADEKAVDSYNETFTCDIHLPIETAKKLRDYLTKILPQ